MKSYLLRENSSELRQELSNMGYRLCCCTEMDEKAWLFTIDGTVHALPDEAQPAALYEINDGKSDCIDCHNNKEMFLEFAKEAINELE
jgi:hypothetical protein